MMDWLVPVGASLLVALVVLGVLDARPAGRAAARARHGAIREAADLRARLDDVRARPRAAHERDMREDLAAARRDQIEAAASRGASSASGSRNSSRARSTRSPRCTQTEHATQRLEARARRLVERSASTCLRSDKRAEARADRATVDEKLQCRRSTSGLGESFRLVVRAARAGAQGPRRDAVAGDRRRRPEARADQRQDARHAGARCSSARCSPRC